MRAILACVGILTLIQIVQADDLESSLKPIVTSHKGKIAVAVKNLETGESWNHNADEVMQTASLIKVAIMVEAYRQANAKELDLKKHVTLKEDDKVPGAGILTSHFSDGASFSIRDAIRLMIVYSDNTATNLVLDQVGIRNVNATMAKFGLGETRINAKVFKGSTTSVDPERTKKYSLGSTTANEMLKLLELIETQKAASTESCQSMLAHLKANDDKQQLIRFLPSRVVLAHKTGATNRVRTDAGILYVPFADDAKKSRPVLICVLTNENDDQRWVLDNAAQVTIAKIGKAVYDSFSKK